VVALKKTKKKRATDKEALLQMDLCRIRHFFAAFVLNIFLGMPVNYIT
jgi:hypothetical protein